MSVVLQTGVMYYRESQSDDWHPLILKVDTDLSALIEDYSQKAWELGEYCRYDSAVYRCTTAITTPEVWDSTHWQETTIGEELKNIIDITGDGDLDSGFTASDLTGAANELKTDIGDLEDITGDGSLSGFTATDLTGAANELKDTLNNLCLKGQKTTINANGTISNISCTGLTANHKVCNWGLYSDVNLTTPIEMNNPPADITITEKADAYDITIANIATTFYIQPTFIIPQN